MRVYFFKLLIFFLFIVIEFIFVVNFISFANRGEVINEFDISNIEESYVNKSSIILIMKDGDHLNIKMVPFEMINYYRWEVNGKNYVSRGSKFSKYLNELYNQEN